MSDLDRSCASRRNANSPLMSIPAELRIEISSYLGFSDLKSPTQCTQVWRATAYDPSVMFRELYLKQSCPRHDFGRNDMSWRLTICPSDFAHLLERANLMNMSRQPIGNSTPESNTWSRMSSKSQWTFEELQCVTQEVKILTYQPKQEWVNELCVESKIPYELLSNVVIQTESSVLFPNAHTYHTPLYMLEELMPDGWTKDVNRCSGGLNHANGTRPWAVHSSQESLYGWLVILLQHLLHTVWFQPCLCCYVALYRSIAIIPL